VIANTVGASTTDSTGTWWFFLVLNTFFFYLFSYFLCSELARGYLNSRLSSRCSRDTYPFDEISWGSFPFRVIVTWSCVDGTTKHSTAKCSGGVPRCFHPTPPIDRPFFFDTMIFPQDSRMSTSEFGLVTLVIKFCPTAWLQVKQTPRLGEDDPTRCHPKIGSRRL